ncbi:MAG: hypothetical protein Q8Q88_22610 [Phenylobacterium sp.]|uniref:hypothetical protein n=1 Tax=Phenylobacterium sp. TaxID=1871053 RepID=UPI0027330CA3|nr:hypothetical protein [Phenylobacterium sp.]MDP3749832.1 hypothetical protein [Phenylobacterium sp.]
MKKRLAFALGLAAVLLAAAYGLRYAEDAGWLGADGARRAMQMLIGLGLAAYANTMPKQLGAARGSPRAESSTQAALRVGGWSFVLAGLAYAALWAFAPLPLADVASMAIVVAAIVATLGYGFWTFTACRRVGRGPASR